MLKKRSFTTLRPVVFLSNQVDKIGMYAVVFQFLNVILGMFSVPILIELLGKEEYAIWILIYSSIIWFSSFDFGVGTYLRIRLTTAKVESDNTTFKQLLTKFYVLLLFFIVFIAILFLIVFYAFNIAERFNLRSLTPTFIYILPALIFYVVLKAINVVYNVQDKTHIPIALQLVQNVIFYSCICITSIFKITSLASVSASFLLSVVLVYGYMTLYSYNRNFKHFKPTIANLHGGENFGKIVKGGSKYFILQLNGLVLFNTMNFLLIRYGGSDEIVFYNSFSKLFVVFNMLLQGYLLPMWSKTAVSYLLKNRSDMISIFKQNMYLLTSITICQIVVLYFGQYLWFEWIGNAVKFSYQIAVFTLVFMFFQNLSAVFHIFLESTANYSKVLVSISVVQTVFFLPMVHFFVGYFTFIEPTNSILLAMIINMFFSSILGFISWKRKLNLL